MLIVETAVAVGMLCASTKRKRAVDDMTPSYAVGSGLTVVSFQASSGSTLENKMTHDIEEMPGVVSVTVQRSGDVFDVMVVMEDTNFEQFNTVAQKKVDLYEDFPGHTFNFNFVTSASFYRQRETMLTSHAA